MTRVRRAGRPDKDIRRSAPDWPLVLILGMLLGFAIMMLRLGVSPTIMLVVTGSLCTLAARLVQSGNRRH